MLCSKGLHMQTKGHSELCSRSVACILYVGPITVSVVILINSVTHMENTVQNVVPTATTAKEGSQNDVMEDKEKR